MNKQAPDPLDTPCVSGSQVEIATGLTRQTLKLYEKQGLLVVARNAHGRRIYSINQIAAIKKIAAEKRQKAADGLRKWFDSFK